MGTLRVIGGDLRRRKLLAPEGSRVRPTSDKVREALFDILGPTLNGLSVLDAFAGSGALGIEALSRGAAHATFVESHPPTVMLLRRNLAALGLEGRAAVKVGSAARLKGVALPGSPFDLAVADPPYGDPSRDEFLASLAESDLLAPGARVVVERDARTEPWLGGNGRLVLARTARYGRTCLDFYRHVHAAPG